MLAVLVKKKRTTSPRLAVSARSGSPATSMTLPKRPIATCVVSETLKRATFPSSTRTSSRVRNKLAVDGWPVLRLGGDDMDVAVQPHLLAVVLADVRVVPVRTDVRDVAVTWNVSPDGESALVRHASRRKLSFSCTPCQCTVASRSPSFVTFYVTLAPSGTLNVTPGSSRCR